MAWSVEMSQLGSVRRVGRDFSVAGDSVRGLVRLSERLRHRGEVAGVLRGHGGETKSPAEYLGGGAASCWYAASPARWQASLAEVKKARCLAGDVDPPEVDGEPGGLLHDTAAAGEGSMRAKPRLQPPSEGLARQPPPSAPTSGNFMTWFWQASAARTSFDRRRRACRLPSCGGMRSRSRGRGDARLLDVDWSRPDIAQLKQARAIGLEPARLVIDGEVTPAGSRPG